MNEPLKIELDVITPITLAHPWIHFDGILAHLMARLVLGEEYYTLPSKEPEINLEKFKEAGIKWPLESIFQDGGDDYVHCASVAQFQSDEFFTTAIYKRFHEPSAHQLSRRRISIASGKFRNYHITLPYKPAGRVIFYAKGDKKLIEELLEHLPALGKKFVIGFGAVRSFNVEKMDKDLSIVNGEGRAMRPLPKWMLIRAEQLMNLAYKPPYWNRRNIMPCAPPGAKVTLKRGLRHG